VKVLAILQARLGSTRLPGKVLMPIQGKPILEHIIDFMRHSKLTDQIVVATTTLTEDNSIEEISKKIGIACYRGDPADVLSRYYECARFFKGDLIVRITGDNPMIDPAVVDDMIRICKEASCDYVSNVLHKTYPIGCSSCEVFTFSILKKLHETRKDKLSREHVTYHIRENPNLYIVKEVLAPAGLSRPNWRLTVDYPEDFELIKEIFSELYVPNSIITYKSLVELLDKNKSLLEINAKYN
jgi:spore coat polysaccharide biosynthesis protein SpsF